MGDGTTDDRTKDPRLILEELVARLKPLVGENFQRAHYGEELDPVVREQMHNGTVYFAAAIDIAQQGLDSGNDDKIAVAALYCQGYERDGVKQAALYELSKLHRKFVEPRRAGGRTTGAHEHKAAEERWQEIIRRYDALTLAGRKPGKAREQVNAEMRLNMNDDYLRRKLKRLKADVS